MNRKLMSKTSAVLLVAVMVVSGSVLMASAENVSQSDVKSSSIIYVPDDYAKIQWVVDNASAGDTIIVRDGFFGAGKVTTHSYTLAGNYTVTLMATDNDGATNSTHKAIYVSPIQYDLTVSSTAGGSVATPGEGTFTYDEGTVVDLVTSPDSGYQFVNWTCDTGTIADPSSASTNITMSENCSINANFEEISPTSPTGWSNPQKAEINNPCRFNIYKDSNGIYWHPYGTSERIYLQTTTTGYNWSYRVEITPDNIDFKNRFGRIYQTSDGAYWYVANPYNWAPNPDTLFCQNSTDGENWSQAYSAIEGIAGHFDFMIDDSDTFWIAAELENGGWHVFRSSDMENWERKQLNINARVVDLVQGANGTYRLFYSPDREKPIYMMTSSDGWNWSSPEKILDLDVTTRLFNVKYYPDVGYILFFGWKGRSNQEVAYVVSKNGDRWKSPQQLTDRDGMDRGARILKAEDGKWVIYWNNRQEGENYYITSDNLSAGPYGEISTTQYDLIVSSTSGGTVTTPGEGNFTYDEDEVVSLVASPNTGYQFVNWSGDTGTIADPNSASTTITMNGNYSITANFKEIPNKPPITSFTYSPSNPAVNQTITFDASSSYDSDGNITSYEWEFGDGSLGTGKTMTYSYSSGGNYTVTLTVTDDDGATNTTSKMIEVSKNVTVPVSWNMTISATNQLEPVIVGMHPNATDGYDPEFDEYTETPIKGKVIMSLDEIYARSIKKTRPYRKPVTWKLSVGVPEDQNTTLSWKVPSMVNLTITENGEEVEPGSELDEGSHRLLITAELSQYISTTIELETGWNMVSVPVVPDNRTVESIFGSIPTLEDRPVVTWEAPQFVEVEKIKPKLGYWVFTPSDTKIGLTGKRIENKTLSLGAGWNMVGTVGVEENLSIDKIPNQVPDRPAVSWEPPSFVETDVIVPGESAWVFITKATATDPTKIEKEIKHMGIQVARKGFVKAKEEVWNLTISATNQLEPVTFGINSNASDGYDKYDEFTQTPIKGKVIMALDDIYAREINKEKMVWNLSVGVPSGQNTTLTWDPSKIPNDIELRMDGINMKTQNSLNLSEGSHEFTIIGKTAPARLFDTGTGTYPSIFGTHTGTITPSATITVSKLYTYPCSGTGGHSEYVKIWNDTWSTEASWNGYKEDWHNITFPESFTLKSGETYNYTIETGSYPQIIHAKEYSAKGGKITCTEFVDANGKEHDDWIPAIRLY